MHLLPIIKKHWKALLISIVIAELVGLVSALLSGDIRSIYLTQLALPPGAPAAWVYGVVWIVLYALIGFAAFSIYFSYEDVRKRRAGLWLYVVQRILLFLWPIMFFRYGSHWGRAFTDYRDRHRHSVRGMVLLAQPQNRGDIRSFVADLAVVRHLFEYRRGLIKLA